MIYLGFIFDYLILLFFPVDTFFVVANIDKNRFLSIIFIGILLDVMYHKLFLNLFILILFYFLAKGIRKRIKSELLFNFIIYGLYFNIMYLSFGYNHSYVWGFFVGIILQLFYIKLSKMLLK